MTLRTPLVLALLLLTLPMTACGPASGDDGGAEAPIETRAMLTEVCGDVATSCSAGNDIDTYAFFACVADELDAAVTVIDSGICEEVVSDLATVVRESTVANPDDPEAACEERVWAVGAPEYDCIQG